MDRLDYVNARIEELQQRIAKNKLAAGAAQELYNKRFRSDPRYNTSMLEYILSGDRSGFDTIAGSLAQYDQMENARNMAIAQRQEQESYNKDEWQKNYQLASAEYDAAATAAAADPNDPVKGAALKKAAVNMNYWGNKLGYSPAEEMVAVEPAVPAGPTQTQQVQIAEAAAEEPEWTNEAKAAAEAEAAAITDPGVRKQKETDIKKRGKTKEEKQEAAEEHKRKVKAIIDNWNPKDPPPEGFEVYFAGGKPHIREKKGK